MGFPDDCDAFEGSLRPDVDASSWSHTYRLAVNTAAAGGPGALRLGTRVSG